MIIYESYWYENKWIWVFYEKLQAVQIGLSRKIPTMVIESINNSQDVVEKTFSRLEE